jgi:hypothetical protein
MSMSALAKDVAEVMPRFIVEQQILAKRRVKGRSRCRQPSITRCFISSSSLPMLLWHFVLRHVNNSSSSWPMPAS